MLDLDTCLKSAEKADVEFMGAQAGVPVSLWETYSAFANTFGGTIVLGVVENPPGVYAVQGVSDPRKKLSELWNILHDPQKISANILQERHLYRRSYQGKEVIVMEVPRADRHDRPVHVGTDMFRGTYRRSHEGDYHCTRAEIKAMLREQSDVSPDSVVLEKTGLDSLNQESIRSYRNLFQLLRPVHVWNGLARDEFLLKIGAARTAGIDGRLHPTLGGLLFFGDFLEIVNEFPDYFLDYRERRSDAGRWTDQICAADGDWSGNIFDFYFRIVDRITADVPKPFSLDRRLLRIDDTEVHKAVREALANTLIHADYYGRQGIVIERRFQQLSFSNPGVFRIPRLEAISGGVSDSRNNRIFNMFSLIKIGERAGLGLCDVFRIWQENGFPRPVVRESVSPERSSLILLLSPAAAPTAPIQRAAPDAAKGDDLRDSKSVAQDGEPPVARGTRADAPKGDGPRDSDAVAQGGESLVAEAVAQETWADVANGDEPRDSNAVAQGGVTLVAPDIAPGTRADAAKGDDLRDSDAVAQGGESPVAEAVAPRTRADAAKGDGPRDYNAVAQDGEPPVAEDVAPGMRADAANGDEPRDSKSVAQGGKSPVAEDAAPGTQADAANGDDLRYGNAVAQGGMGAGLDLLREVDIRIYEQVCGSRGSDSRAIAGLLKMHVRSIQRSLRRLEDLGFVVRQGAGRHVEWHPAGKEYSQATRPLRTPGVVESDETDAYGAVLHRQADLEKQVAGLIARKYGFLPGTAAREFESSLTCRMLRKDDGGLSSFPAGDILQVWETERITGSPRNSRLLWPRAAGRRNQE